MSFAALQNMITLFGRLVAFSFYIFQLPIMVLSVGILLSPKK